MSVNLARLTIFALISAVEHDFRFLITENLDDTNINTEYFFSKELCDKLVNRYKKSNIGEPTEIADLIVYLDFEEHLSVINRNRNLFSDEIGQYFNRIGNSLTILTPIRNRVFHSRPLEISDLPTLLEATNTLVVTGPDYWKTLSKTLKMIREDPFSVLGIKIPEYNITDEKITHNLPLPDFDETGYIGRETVLRSIIKQLLGPYPVITIVGEGGLGKTAIALKAAYEILDSEKCPFDAIIWSTSKTMQLTTNEVTAIKDSINSSLKLFTYIENELSGIDTDNPEDEVLQYLENFKILLIIDNMETILDDRLRTFLTQLPNGSKVLITSRIGLGAFEVPIKLEPLSSKESTQLFRQIVKNRSISQLSSLHDTQLTQYLNKMNNNPGHIKWFCSAIQAGKRIEEILANSSVFIDFCMSNVYEYLSSNAKNLLRNMICANMECGQAELGYITNYDTLILQKALQELLSTNMIKTNSIRIDSTTDTKYEINDLAREYIQKSHPIKTEEYKKIRSQFNRLLSEREQYQPSGVTNPYSAYTINVRSTADIIIAKMLSEAIEFSKLRNFSKCDIIINNAKALAPNYYEVRRIEAWIKSQQGEISSANDAYKAAIDLNNMFSPLRYWYAMFLMNNVNDILAASYQLEKCIELDPDNLETRFQLARVYLYQKMYEKSISQIKIIEEQKTDNIYFLTKTWDLKLQIVYRQADNYFENGNYIETINYLNKLKETFILCPENIYDRTMLRIFNKTDRLIRMLRKVAPELNDKINIFEKWKLSCADNSTNSVTKTYSCKGRIHKIWRDRDYGFIMDSNGQSIYFKRNSIEIPVFRINAKFGDNVLFNLKYNENKTEAINIIKE